MWDLTWGNNIEFLNKVAAGAKTEEEVPECLRTRPVLSQYQEPVYNMYMELTGSRVYTSNGMAEIPYYVKVLWLDENEVHDKDDRNYYLYLLAAIDSAYLKHFYANRG